MGPHNITQFLACGEENQEVYFYLIYLILFTTAKLNISTLPGEGPLCGVGHCRQI